MNLETKLGLGSGVLVSAMLLSAIMANLRVREANNLSETVTTKMVPLIMLMKVINSEVSDCTQIVENYMLFGTTPTASIQLRIKRRDALQRATQAIAEFHKQADLATLNSVDRDRLNRIELDVTRMKQVENEIEVSNEMHTPEDRAHAIDLVRDVLLPLDDAMDKLVTAVTDSQEAIATGYNERLRLAQHDIVVTLWICTILSALLGAAISVLLIDTITRSLRKLTDRAHAIAEGDLTGGDLAEVSNDQIGSLALAMQKMQASLAAVIGTTADTAGILTASADLMHVASDQMHHRIEEQSEQTQQAATGLHEMSTSIDEVSRLAQATADHARSAAQTAREGGIIVKEMLDSMAGISTAVEETSSSLGLLGQDSRRISQIITVIEDIARTTNLLALNAAIEAARAGDQGRGFAVIASEVRRLAESTAQATGQVAAMIKGIQGRTQTAIARMETGTVTVTEGARTTQRAGEALARIIVMADKVDRMIAQIAIAATQQAVAANQSSASLHAIYSLSRDNLGEISTTAAGIENLRATALSLEMHIARFQRHPEPPALIEAERSVPRVAEEEPLAHA